MEFVPDPRGQRGPGLAYLCPRCRREILFSWVEYMGRIEEGQFVLMYKCGCDSNLLHEHNLEVEHGALKRLLGGLRPVLPYRAAPARACPLRPEQELQIGVFQWELEQLSGVREFLFWCRRPALP